MIYNIKIPFVIVLFTVSIFSSRSFALRMVDDTSHRSFSISDEKCDKKPNELVKDDPILIMLDSLAHQKYINFSNFTTDRNILNVHKFPEGFVPYYSYSTYNQKIEKLDQQTPFKLVYNEDVKQFIDLYAVRKAKLTEKILGLSELYFPLFEEQLSKYNLPLELKYLAVIESALCPVAVSPAGAGGLWQFMYYTGKLYGLKINSYVDERYDPYKATDAACRYLKYLYSLFHDWTLVIAAYNVGEGNITKAIRRSGGETDFWKIRRFLPAETRSYVPAFIAVNYVLNYSADHNIYPTAPNFLFHDVDTIKIRQTLRFDQIAEFLNIPYSDLAFLNPAYKLGVIPATPEENYVLRLPKKYVGDFINNETALYNYKTKQDIERENVAKTRNKVFINGQSFEKHTVSYGENLQMVADEYGCTKDNIKKWNKLKRDKLRPNETLLILVKSDTTFVKVDSTDLKMQNVMAADSTFKAKQQAQKLQEQSNATKAPVITTVRYTVKAGESLGLIAKRNGCSLSDLKKWNTLKTDVVHPKQTLIVKVISTPAKKDQIVKQTEAAKVVKKDEKKNPVVKEKNIAKDSLAANKDTLKKESIATNDSNPSKQNVNQQNQHPVKYIYHTVQQGDTLWSIAQKYKAFTVSELKKINNLNGANSLKPGQKIKVGVSS